ncbi:hypothetical protein BJV82DRAFT_619305 [Fennellomyces sp. T-0311]|nr:hypothetical protein BJV82DRAFT_619305 [Fennellomyces sp. T-0311]
MEEMTLRSLTSQFQGCTSRFQRTTHRCPRSGEIHKTHIKLCPTWRSLRCTLCSRSLPHPA